MAERPVKAPSPEGKGGFVDAFDVPILESSERWSEFTLEDGTVFRVKLSLASALRIPGQWDEEGNPMYALKTQPSMVLVSTPERLQKPKA